MAIIKAVKNSHSSVKHIINYVTKKENVAQQIKVPISCTKMSN